MKKLPLFITILFSVISVSCSNDENNPVFPTEDNVAGYWKLNKITKDGSEVAFNDYPSSMTSHSLDNMYYAFPNDKKATHTIEHSISVLVRKGEWALEKDTLTADYGSWGVEKFKVLSFNQEEITIAEAFLPKYHLTFERIAEEDYPWTAMTAVVNEQPFSARSNQAYDEGGYIQLTGDNSNSDWISIQINNPTSLIAGQTYSMDNSNISAVYVSAGDYSNIFGSFEGEIGVLEISDTYIDCTFKYQAKTTGGDVVNITGGAFKAIIKDN